MKIYNLIPFYNELDLLEIRLHTMSHYVDYFVICEMNKTHTNLEKPFYYEENKERFKNFSHKIIHAKVESPEYSNPWGNENFQRQVMMNWLVGSAENDDLLIVQDADEILPENFLEILKPYLPLTSPKALYQKFYRYYLNGGIANMNEPEGRRWTSGPICTYQQALQSGLQQLRDSHHKLRATGNFIDNCGWHFTFLGGAEKIAEKLNAYAHQEWRSEAWRGDVQNIQKALQEGKDAVNPKSPYPIKKIDLDETFPKYILNNLEKFEKYIC